MSKTIELEELRAKRETFSEAAARLISFHREITRVDYIFTLKNLFMPFPEPLRAW